MPTSYDVDKEDRIINNAKSRKNYLPLLVAIVILTLLCVAGIIAMWGWLVSNGGV